MSGSTFWIINGGLMLSWGINTGKSHAVDGCLLWWRRFHVVVTCFALLSLGGARGASDCCHDWSNVNGREAVGRTHFMGSHWLMTPALQRPRLRSHGVDRRSPNLASRSHSSQIGGAAAEAGAPKLAAPSQPCSLPESRKSPWAMDGWSAMLTRLARGNFRLPRLFFSIPKMACFARK